MRAWLLLATGLTVCACTSPVGAPTAADASAAEAFVASSLLVQYPDYPEPEAAARCIREHATDEEVLLLAGAQGSGRAQPRRSLGVVIAQRPETQACFSDANLPALR